MPPRHYVSSRALLDPNSPSTLQKSSAARAQDFFDEDQYASRKRGRVEQPAFEMISQELGLYIGFRVQGLGFMGGYIEVQAAGRLWGLGCLIWPFIVHQFVVQTISYNIAC